MLNEPLEIVMALILSLPSILLLGLFLVPNALVLSRPGIIARVVMLGTFAASMAGFLGLMLVLSQGVRSWNWHPSGWPSGLELGVLLDGFGCSLMMMIGVVGWSVARYAKKNLTDDKGMGLFLKWTGITVGSILLGVIASNLAQMLVAFLLSGISVHGLLTHHGNRPEAVRTAWTKFSFNRVADGLFLVAAVLLFKNYETLDFQDLYAVVGKSGESTETVFWAALMLAGGAVIRSVQFPFHVWLPGSLEAPTPVSALLHAGVVNAGGMILIRVFPILATEPLVLAMLVAIGAITAWTAALTMATQTTVKRQLVHGTISQMGFMVLQCGLGCPGAALLHILAHSIYKAHAFLGSGDSWMVRPVRQHASRIALPVLLATAWILPLLVFGGMFLSGMEPQDGAGLFLLGFILSLGVLGWLKTHGLDSKTFLIRALPAVAGLLVVYFGLSAGLKGLLEMGWPSLPMVHSSWWLIALICVGFLGLFSLEHAWMQPQSHQRMLALRAHARNGFYLDLLWKRFTSCLNS